ncbi:hypothetical protein [Escherichia coli]|uniref:hypothetical protein n=1 Tax=Escherichia coli TaxID=562 RepID=UPI003CE8B8E1
MSIKNDGHYFCGAGGNRPDGSDEALTLTIIADSDEMQELREELYQVKQAVKGMRDGMFSALNES